MKDSAYPIIFFASPVEWEKWLETEHSAPGVWVKFAKKASGIVSMQYDEALDIALCYGWIDGLSKGLDEKYYLQKFTPRGPKSIWSKRNREIVGRLIKSGKMQPAGMEKINDAKKDGRWDNAYDSPATMVIPEDFLQELTKDKKAFTFFQTLNKTNTYAIAWRLQTAKKPETRARRMKVLLAMLHEEKKLY